MVSSWLGSGEASRDPNSFTNECDHETSSRCIRVMAASLRPTILWSAARRLWRQGSFSPGPGVLQLQHTGTGTQGSRADQRGWVSTVPSGSLPALEYIKAHLSWGRPGAKTGVYAKQHSVSLPRAASQPPLPSSFYPGNCCRVPTVRRWRVLYCTGVTRHSYSI